MKQRDYGLDTLKAVSITFVLLWHLQPFRYFLQVDITIVNKIFIVFFHILNFQIFLTAVPVFILVSIYLFFEKAQKNYHYLKKRVIRIFQLFAFWSITQVTFSYLVTGNFPSVSVETIIGVKPGLPIVGDSVFFFLFDLLVLITLAFIYLRLNSNLKNILSYIAIVTFLLYFEAIRLPTINILIPYWSLKNFLVYIPIALLLLNYKERIIKFKFYYLFAYIVFSIQDVYLRHHGYETCVYARDSIIFGSLTLFCFIYPLKFRTSKHIQMLGKYSLGIYALHKYWHYLFILLLVKPSNMSNFGLRMETLWLIVALTTLIFTFLSVYVLSKTRLKAFVA